LVDQGDYHYSGRDLNVFAYAVEHASSPRLYGISSRTDEAMRHVQITLAPGMGAKLNILLQLLERIINNRPHDENLDSLSTIFGMASTLLILFSGDRPEEKGGQTLRRPVGQSGGCEDHVRRRILSSKPPTSQIGAGAI